MKELETIQAALDGVAIPDWVLRLRPELITDADGDPALAVWVVIPEGELDVLNSGLRLGQLRQLIHDALRASEIERWPYVRFQSEHEMAR